jgi:hypothetical protein
MKIFFGWAGPPDDILRRRLEPEGSGNKLAIIFQQAISDKQRPSGHRGGRCRQSLMMSSRLKALLDSRSWIRRENAR